jgi:hypothetical protein
MLSLSAGYLPVPADTRLGWVSWACLLAAIRFGATQTGSSRQGRPRVCAALLLAARPIAQPRYPSALARPCCA